MCGHHVAMDDPFALCNKLLSNVKIVYENAVNKY